MVLFHNIQQLVNTLQAKTETKIIDVTLFYSFLTSVSNILRDAFYYHYLQTVEVLCKSMDILKKYPNPLNALLNANETFLVTHCRSWKRIH